MAAKSAIFEEMLLRKVSRIWMVSAIALLALLGLLFIQFSWLEGMIQIREDRFNEAARQVLLTAEQAFEPYVSQYVDLHLVLSHEDEFEKDRLRKVVSVLLDSVLQAKGLQTDFEFGLQSCKNTQFQLFSNPALSEEILQGTQVKLAGSSIKLKGGPNNHLHLYAIFPRKSSFILSQMSGAIGSSLLFVLIIGGAFIYTLASLLRQRKLSEMKNDFVNNLTHEFKTPIASITLAARTLRQLPSVSTSDKAMDYIQLIDQEGKRLENHVDKVLQVASIDSGNFMLDKQEVVVQALIQNVLSSLQLQIADRKASVHTHFAEAETRLQADRVHLFNILYNLVDNAIKYAGHDLQLHIHVWRKDECVELKVQDNGPGIAAPIQDRIFEPFFRPPAGNVHKVRGFGLGLYYVRRLVEAHQGQIELHSSADLGTTFTLTFPIS